MMLLFLLVFVTFGVIIVTEKLAPYYTNKVEKKLTAYLKESHADIKENLNISKVTYDKTKYQMKVTSKENKYLYFYIFYKNKKITSTYNSDYLEGNSLFNKLEKNLKQKIKKETSLETEVSMNTTLNKYTKVIQQEIIKNKKIHNLKVYNITLDLIVSAITTQELTTQLTKINQKLNTNNITPSYYNITYTDKQDITNALEIKNLSKEIIESSSFPRIIDDIINKTESDILKTNKITYHYLNKGE